MKYAANFWLLALGSGGGDGPLPPMPPTLSGVTAGFNAVTATWKAPSDDGGSPITSYVVEVSTDQKVWTPGATVLALSATVSGLTAGVTYYVRVKAQNTAGLSDPSNISSAVPLVPYNEATGGTITDVPNYNGSGQTWRVHAFTASGTFNVTRSVNPFSVLAVAGGTGGGDSFIGTGGNGGGVQSFTLTAAQCPVGPYGITVGARGPGPANPRQPGGASTAFGVTAQPDAGAAGGPASGNPNVSPPGGNGGTGVASAITGSTDYYGSGGGGGGGINGTTGQSGPGYYGRGGRGSNWSGAGFNGEQGNPGFVAIAYRIG